MMVLIRQYVRSVTDCMDIYAAPDYDDESHQKRPNASICSPQSGSDALKGHTALMTDRRPPSIKHV